jgi:hypothetical protein
VPEFDRPLLDRIGRAVGRRAKSILYQAGRFACTRTQESDAEERLDLEVDSLEDRPTRTFLSVWPHGAATLSVHQRNTYREGGWAFSYLGFGNVMDLEPVDVVRTFEETLLLVYGSVRSPDAADRIEHVWRSAGLQRKQ